MLKISSVITILLSVLFSYLLFYVIDKKIKYARINDMEKLTQLALSIDSALNLGEIPNNEEKTFSFYIRNKGYNKLYVTDINASCGCSKISTSKSQAVVGDSIEVFFSIKPNNNLGDNLVVINFVANTKVKNHKVRITYSCKK